MVARLLLRFFLFDIDYQLLAPFQIVGILEETNMVTKGRHGGQCELTRQQLKDDRQPALFRDQGPDLIGQNMLLFGNLKTIVVF